MKPSWDDAPEWANWLAHDGCNWIWFERKPEFEWDPISTAKVGALVGIPGAVDSRNSLEPRP